MEVAAQPPAFLLAGGHQPFPRALQLPGRVVPAGSGFVDQGHDVHVVRNEGSVDLVTVVVSLVPAGFARRIDEPSPGTCLPDG